MVMLDPLSTVFAEVAKGKQAINMALLPVTEKGQPGYEVERVEEVDSFHTPGKKSFILHLRIRGKKVKVWSRTSIDYLIRSGYDAARLRAKGYGVELRVIAKNPLPGRAGVFEVEGTLAKVRAAQQGLSLESEQAEEGVSATSEEEAAMEQRLTYLLHGKEEDPSTAEFVNGETCLLDNPDWPDSGERVVIKGVFSGTKATETTFVYTVRYEKTGQVRERVNEYDLLSWDPRAKYNKGQEVWQVDYWGPDAAWPQAMPVVVTGVQDVTGYGISYSVRSADSPGRQDREWLVAERALGSTYEEGCAADDRCEEQREAESTALKFSPGQIVFYNESEIGTIGEDRPECDEEGNEDYYPGGHKGDIEFDPLYYFTPFSSSNDADTICCRESDLSLEPSDYFLEQWEAASAEDGSAQAAPDADEPETIRIVDRSKSRMSTGWRHIDFNTNEEFTLAYAIDQYNQGLPAGEGFFQLIEGKSPLRKALTKGGRPSHRIPDNFVLYTKDGNQVAALIEVDGTSHDGRYREDAEREAMFHHDGVLNIIHVSNEDLRSDPQAVVRRIAARLEQLRRTGITINGGAGIDF